VSDWDWGRADTKEIVEAIKDGRPVMTTGDLSQVTMLAVSELRVERAELRAALYEALAHIPHDHSTATGGASVTRGPDGKQRYERIAGSDCSAQCPRCRFKRAHERALSEITTPSAERGAPVRDRARELRESGHDDLAEDLDRMADRLDDASTPKEQ